MDKDNDIQSEAVDQGDNPPPIRRRRLPTRYNKLAESAPTGNDATAGTLRVLANMSGTRSGLSKTRSDSKGAAAELSLLRRQHRPTWEKLSCETEQAFHYFCVYRDLGPERSLQAMARALGLKARAYAARFLPHDYFWVERAAEFDEWQENSEMRAQQAAQAAQDAEILKWAERTAALAESEFDVGAAMFDVVRTRMNRARGFEEITLPDGSKVRRMIPAEPLDVEDKQLPAFAKAGLLIMERGIERFRGNYDVQRGAYHSVPALPADLTEVSDEDLLTYAQRLVEQGLGEAQKDKTGRKGRK